MAQPIDALAERLDNLQESFIQSQINIVPVIAKADDATERIPQIDDNTANIGVNTEDIVTTQEGLAETYEEMNTSVLEVEEALAEVYEMIIGG